MIESYLPEPPDRYPAYLERRACQGTSGRVYPMLFHDGISASSTVVEWDAVHLENRWLRIMVLPQLGGRIHIGYDRSADYHFFYHNRVIKPALVGLTGPWIAGGVEFNWPQHHRPATFLPTDVEIEHGPDGAVTVWCSDHDPFTRMKGMHGIQLRPDRAVLEVRARLYNRNERTQTFLWWANAAARVHEQYQSFFPRDVRMIVDHGKRAVSAFPAADRPYYGIDYPARRKTGEDRLDWYRNIIAPTSYMSPGSREGFLGGYDHSARAGFVHVADPHVAVGKKHWTWGNSPFGRAWHANLSDDGAPYVELMAGLFTDNLPDFSFLGPGETKVFSQVWYPIQEIGPVHAATVDAAVRVDVEADAVQVGIVVTAERPGCRVRLEDGAGNVVTDFHEDLAPGSPLRRRIVVDVPDRLVLRVSHAGVELVSWDSHVPDAGAEAVPAKEPPAPGDVASVEELAVIGAHLEQYRHATRSPEPYWREALRRDAGHVASGIGLARRSYQQGDYRGAEALLLVAVDRLTSLNAHPADTTALYELGLALERQGRGAEAYARYAAASWSRTWRAPAGYRMARLDAAAGRDAAALKHLADVRRVEPEHLQARALTALLLRRTGRPEEAVALLRETLVLDPLDWWSRDLLGLPLTTDAQTCLDVALEYSGVGEHASVLRVLAVAAQREADRVPGQTAAGLLIEYHRAEALERLGHTDEARVVREESRTVDASWCFASRLDDVDALERVEAGDARALAMLGHWRYAVGRADDAMSAWRESAELDPGDPVVWRNLGLAAWNHLGDAEQARGAYDRALNVAGAADARLVFESDQLDARRGVPPAQRLERLLAVREVVESRDDATVALVHLLLTAGRLGDARALLLGRRFQPWEGSEGEVLAAWERLCCLEAEWSTSSAAVFFLDAALDPPASLGEARHPLASIAALQLRRGDALAVTGETDAARSAWELAARDGDVRGISAEQRSRATYASALALHRLGRGTEARSRSASLRAFVDALEDAPPSLDYFATFFPSPPFAEDPALALRKRVLFLRAQLDVLDGKVGVARVRLDALLAQDPHHLDALELGSSLRAPVHSPQAVDAD